MKQFPNISSNDNDTLMNAINYIARVRNEDITASDNASQTYLSGRSVGKIPTSSSDVESSDRAGDMSYDETALYICVESGDTVKWVKTALAEF